MFETDSDRRLLMMMLNAGLGGFFKLQVLLSCLEIILKENNNICFLVLWMVIKEAENRRVEKILLFNLSRINNVTHTESIWKVWLSDRRRSNEIFSVRNEDWTDKTSFSDYHFGELFYYYWRHRVRRVL